MLRAVLDSGNVIVKLKHFRVCASHISLLKNLQREVPDLEVLVFHTDSSASVVRVCRINLDPEKLRFLNPSA